MAISRAQMGSQMTGNRKMKKKMSAGGKATPPWEKKNPKKKSKPLTDAQKAKAKASARRAGRKYPNLVDNMKASGSRN